MLLSCGVPFYGQTTYNWKSAANGVMDDAASWTPDNFSPDNAQLVFGLAGSYQVGLTENMAARYVVLRGTSGTVTLNLGTHELQLSSIFQINQDTRFESGKITGTTQIGSAVSGKALTVTGSATSLVSNSGVFVGRNDANNAGNSNALTLSGGATFDVTGSITVGDNNVAGATANQNSLTVTGSGTSLKASSTLIVGNLTQNDSASQANNNSFTLSDGASAQVGGLTIARRPGTVTTNTNAKGNTATVTAASLTINGAVTVGSIGGDNVFTVEQGSSVIVTGTTTINNGVRNALVVDNANYTATGQKMIVYGSSALKVLGTATLTAGELDMRANLNTSGNAVLNLEKLTLATTSVIDVTIGSSTEYTRINLSAPTGAAAFNGIFNLTFANGYEAEAGAEFHIFNFTNATGEFTELRLPGLANGLQWDTSHFYQTGTLSVIPEAGAYALSLSALGVLAGLSASKRLTRH